MTNQDRENNNQPNYEKITKLLQGIEKATEEERQIIAKEVEKEIFKQLTEEAKKEIDSHVKSYLNYHERVIVPKEKFVYPNRAIGKVPQMNQEIKFKTFEFNTVILRDDEIFKIPKQTSYFLEDLGNGIILQMVYIPGGSFLMGVSNTELEANEYFYWGTEQPQHLVNVPDFFLGKFSITQEQWEVIMSHNLSANQGENSPKNLPVENTSWLDATEFCKRLSLKTGRNYRLPSEAEWEYACRARTTTLYNFGNMINTDLANYWDTDAEDIYIETKPVGSYYPNAFGLYDMHGNVYELCQDAWHDHYEGAPTNGSAWGNGGEEGLVVIRGGSFDYDEDRCYCAYRSETRPEYRYHGTGFRVACSI